MVTVPRAKKHGA